MEKITLIFKERYFFKIFFLLIFLVLFITFLPRIFAELQPVKSIEIFSEKLSYQNKEPGSWKIIKSAKWTSQGEAEITFDIDSILKTKTNGTDLILVLDTSASMKGEKIASLKSDTINLLEDFFKNENNRASLITFDSGSEILANLTNNKTELVDKVYSLTYRFMTNYYDALVNVEKVLENYNKEDDRECVILFLTDGYPNEGTPNEIGQYNYLKERYPFGG